jgi:hypothetical protein
LAWKSLSRPKPKAITDRLLGRCNEEVLIASAEEKIMFTKEEKTKMRAFIGMVQEGLEIFCMAVGYICDRLSQLLLLGR